MALSELEKHGNSATAHARWCRGVPGHSASAGGAGAGSLEPKPVVLLNLAWSFDEEEE
jgi:hypothetical protein